VHIHCLSCSHDRFSKLPKADLVEDYIKAYFYEEKDLDIWSKKVTLGKVFLASYFYHLFLIVGLHTLTNQSIAKEHAKKQTNNISF
jgi:hypothetical protein